MAKGKQRGGQKPNVQADRDDEGGDILFNDRKKSSVKAIFDWDDVGGDSEDEFHDQREVIKFGDDKQSRRLSRRGDSDDADGMDDEVLALEGVDDDDDDEEEEEDEDEDEDAVGRDKDIDALDDEDDQELERVTRNLVGAPVGSDDEEEVGFAKKRGTEEDYDGAWGRSRRQFYDNDDDGQDEMAAKEEEAEALRLQRKRVEAMTEADFLDDDFEDSLANRVAELEGDKLRKSGSGGASSYFKAPLGFTEGEDVVNLTVEERRAALERLDPEERMQMARVRAPEVVRLLDEFDRRWEEIKGRIGPAVGWLRDYEKKARRESGGDAEEDEGNPVVGYAVLKYRLVMTFLTNVSFYLAIRAEPPQGVDARNHPVLDVLTELSDLLNGLESNVEGLESEDDADADEAEEDDQLTEKERRRERKRKRKQKRRGGPRGFVNLMTMVEDFIAGGGLMADDVDLFDEDDIKAMNDEELDEAINRAKASLPDEDTSNEEKAPSRLNRLEDTNGNTNRPSKKEGAKQKKAEGKAAGNGDQVTRKSSKVNKKNVAKESEPVEDDDFEITPFVSLKKEEIKRRKADAKRELLASRDDIGIELSTADLLEKQRRRKEVSYRVTKADKKLKAGKGLQGDMDVPKVDKSGKLLQSKFLVGDDEGEDGPAEMVQEGPDNSALDDIDPELEFGLDELDDVEFGGEEELLFGSMKKRKASDEEEAGEPAVDKPMSKTQMKKAKRAAEAAAAAAALESGEAVDDRLYDENDLSNAKRASTWAMLSNKGLTPHRKKENRNPRVRKRMKFEQASKRLKSVRAVAADRSKIGAYKGELTGIKTRLTKSTKF
ncbi:hypothetical protein HK101_010213 [Irineochytrium annulatum]|nr:hypothetical protein HK101_010213 [Irineochytrium annulatum]